MGKEAAPQRQPAKAGSSQGGKVERLSASKQHRDAKRQELLDKKRRSSAPIVVAVLPLSAVSPSLRHHPQAIPFERQ